MAKESVSEEDILLRKRARRRLVGAIALAVLAAIFLPMILDGEMKPVGEEVSVQIPDKKAALPPVSAPKAEPVSMPASASKVEPAASAPKAEQKPSPKETPKGEQKAAPSRTDEKPKADAASRDEKPKAEAKPKEGKTEKYVVQLGVFSHAVNARQLQEKLAAGGIKTYTESLKTDKGEKTRVRAGPYSSREAADGARAKLKLMGVEGVIAAIP